MGENTFRGFIVHAYTDRRRNRLYIVGRLEDGKSFAAVETRWRPSLLIYQRDRENVQRCLSSFHFEFCPTELEAFENGESLFKLKFETFSARSSAASLLEENGILIPDSGQKPADAFLSERGISGVVEIKGQPEQGRLVDMIFQNPELSSCPGFSPLNVPLRICSVDIETDISSGTILAIGMCVYPRNSMKDRLSIVRVLQSEIIENNKPQSNTEEEEINLFFHPDEKSLLEAFLVDVRKADPDCLTGWNFLDFDYPKLAERSAFHRIPFTLGRSKEEAVFFPGSSGDGSWTDRRRSATALVPGRQVIDALRIVRSGPQKHSSYTLEAVAQSVLGEGKIVTSSGKQKIEELAQLYRDDPKSFGSYCLRDAELVCEILDRTGLLRLTLERASLTGVSLDKAWTSVVSFERIYGMELFKRKIATPSKYSIYNVSGAAGGTILDPPPGIFSNVGVFDFRSLYPTIMRTFNIDPLSFARAHKNNTQVIKAPNNAVFSKEPGILKDIISSFFASRSKALEEGDKEASHVYKILMNSFYGVLGTSSCRYGRTEIAGAITSFARKWLLFSRDWFSEKGYSVLYGDTDSLFVESQLGDKASYETFLKWGNTFAAELTSCIAGVIAKEYGLHSFIELRFEKPYRRFMIPPLRNVKPKDASDESRGRAKGYGGWLLDTEDQLTIEIKGMEAVRSDSTPLARRIQVELLELVFNGCSENELKDAAAQILKQLRSGLLDEELVYRKRLTRPPEQYTSSTPPQVKAARALGWKNRRGTIEYIWTVSGPEPAELWLAEKKPPLDYDHYADAQVLSVARSIAAAAGWNSEALFPLKHDYSNDDQIEMEF